MPNPHPRVDWTGRQFNRWTVISRMPGLRSKTQAWLCRCICGNESAVQANNLKSGASKSCGCYNREVASARMKGKPSRNIKPGDIGSRNSLLCRHRHVAKKRGLEWTLTDEQAFAIYKGDCFYCGATPAQTTHGWKSERTLPYVYNGLDRIDSSLGYVASNVVSCCGTCNQAKSDTPLAEFKAWIDRVHEHLHNRKRLTSVK